MKDKVRALVIISCITTLLVAAIIAFYPFQRIGGYLEEFEDLLPIAVYSGTFESYTDPPVQVISTPILFDRFMELVYSPQAMHVSRGGHAQYYVSIKPKDTTGVQIVYMYQINPFELIEYLDAQFYLDAQYFLNLSKVSEQNGVIRTSNITLLYETSWLNRTGSKRPPLYTARRAFYLPSKSLRARAPMIEGVNEFNKSTWMSPIIWSTNVTESDVYHFSIPSQGWYIVSLCGRVWYYSGTGPLQSRQGGYQTGGWGDLDGWLSLDDLIAEARIYVLGGGGILFDFAIAHEADIK